jgi:hypothetical protein
LNSLDFNRVCFNHNSKLFLWIFNFFFSLQMLIEATLKPNWDWLMLVMDSTEAQLRFGSALANSTDPNQPGHPMSARSSASVASRIAASVSTGEPAASTSRGFTGARSGN